MRNNTPRNFVQTRARTGLHPGASDPVGRMIVAKAVVHTADLAAEGDYIERRSPGIIAAVEVGGIRTLLAVPLLKDNQLIGSFHLSRQEVRPFTDKQIEIVSSFAAQAVIAIENTGLLKELRDRTDEVETLNQQLEQRVADQVGEIERTSRLRRFLPPQVADLIVSDDEFADGRMVVAQQGHHGFRIRTFGEPGEPAQVAEQRGYLSTRCVWLREATRKPSSRCRNQSRARGGSRFASKLRGRHAIQVPSAQPGGPGSRLGLDRDGGLQRRHQRIVRGCRYT